MATRESDRAFQEALREQIERVFPEGTPHRSSSPCSLKSTKAKVGSRSPRRAMVLTDTKADRGSSASTPKKSEKSVAATREIVAGDSPNDISG